MGSGFSDECMFNLRGQTLEFNFTPETLNLTDRTNSLARKELRNISHALILKYPKRSSVGFTAAPPPPYPRHYKQYKPAHPS
jgi:hypothetical protein